MLARKHISKRSAEPRFGARGFLFQILAFSFGWPKHTMEKDRA